MNMNVYAIENHMFERKYQIESAAMDAWKWADEKKQIHLLGSLTSKLVLAKEKAQVQTPACCG